MLIVQKLFVIDKMIERKKSVMKKPIENEMIEIILN